VAIALAVVPLDPPTRQRPRTRGDCLPGGSNEARPCPFRCRYELPRGRCALDVADAGDHTLEEVAEAFGFSRQAAANAETRALNRLRVRLRVLVAADPSRATADAVHSRGMVAKSRGAAELAAVCARDGVSRTAARLGLSARGLHYITIAKRSPGPSTRKTIEAVLGIAGEAFDAPVDEHLAELERLRAQAEERLRRLDLAELRRVLEQLSV
jgi:transcriptional regulator with XRE-family HTH domain